MVERKCELPKEDYDELVRLYFHPLMKLNDNINKEIFCLGELKAYVNEEFKGFKDDKKKVSAYNAAYKMIEDGLKETKLEMDKLIVSLMMEVADEATFKKVLKIQ